MVHLTDGVVRLRLPVDDDVPAIVAACQDPAIARYTTVPSPYRTEHAQGFVHEHAAGGWADWAARGTAIERELPWLIEADGALAGMIGLKLEPQACAEVGYWLAPQARGRGLLHRALLLALAWGFDAADGPRLDRVSWRAVAGNWPSWRAAWRVGFTFEGVGRLALPGRDGREDGWSGSLLRDDPRSPTAPWPATTVPAPQPS